MHLLVPQLQHLLAVKTHQTNKNKRGGGNISINEPAKEPEKEPEDKKDPSNEKTEENDTTSLYPEYELKFNEASGDNDVGYLLQIDNDGSQDENGLKISVSNLKIAIKIGDADWQEKDLGTVELTPDEYSDPKYSKTSKRTKIPDVKIEKATTVKIKVVSATVSNKDKESAILFALQRDGGDYQFFGISNDQLWKPAFVAAK